MTIELKCTVTDNDILLWEAEAEKYAEKTFEQFPDSGMGHTLNDVNFDIKQEYFLEGVEWILLKLAKRLEYGK
jgi:hypothetical protein